ncbi:MAG: hypothetical protein CL534_01310 [Ahrensia sp.]|nr:hypothetical protein [Ahrensia sp.]
MNKLPTILAAMLTSLLLLSGLSPSSAGSGQTGPLMLSDQQMIRLTITSGPGSDRKGSLGIGKFRQGFSAKYNTFGGRDHPVLVHTRSKLTYKGPRTTCTLTIDRKIRCKNGASGTWDYEN